MTLILGMAGRKQSGKNTCCNAVYAANMTSLGVCEASKIDENGEILVSDIRGEKIKGKEYFGFNSKNINIPLIQADLIDEHIKMYAFADPLKRFVIDVFGVESHKIYGTDEQKNMFTHIKWSDAPGMVPSGLTIPNKWKKYLSHIPEEAVDPKGFMTGRELLQFFGTEVCRRMFQGVWVNATLNKIKRDSPQIALISDVRFGNEIIGIQEAGGYVIGLLRDIFNSSHASEQIELEKCDEVLENTDTSIEETLEMLFGALRSIEEANDLNGKSFLPSVLYSQVAV